MCSNLSKNEIPLLLCCHLLAKEKKMIRPWHSVWPNSHTCHERFDDMSPRAWARVERKRLEDRLLWSASHETSAPSKWKLIQQPQLPEQRGGKRRWNVLIITARGCSLTWSSAVVVVDTAGIRYCEVPTDPAPWPSSKHNPYRGTWFATLMYRTRFPSGYREMGLFSFRLHSVNLQAWLC